MKQQFNRARRHSNRSAHAVQPQQIFRYTNLDSSGPLGKLRGTPLQLAEKYQAGAKDAAMQGDDVCMQTCQQYADHYMRLQAIAIENEQSLKAKTQVVPVQHTEETENTDLPKEEVSVPVDDKPSDTIDPTVLPPVSE